MRMKTKILMALAIFLPFIATAQMMPDSTVQIVAYWEKGDRVVYECKNTTKQIEVDGTGTTKQASSETRIFEVIEETDSSYVLQTSYRDVFSSQVSLNIGADIVSRLSEGIIIQTRTDQFGAIEEVVNVDALIEAMKRTVPVAVDATLAKYDKKTLEEMGAVREALIDSYTELLCRPETVVSTCMEDVQPLLFYHGARLSLDEEYAITQQFSNPLGGGGSFEADIKFWVDTENSDSTMVIIRSYMSVDSDVLMPFVREAIAAASGALMPDGISQEELMAEVDKHIADTHMEMTLEQYSATAIDLYSGWPLLWWSKRIIVNTSDEGKVENTEEREVKAVDE